MEKRSRIAATNATTTTVSSLYSLRAKREGYYFFSFFSRSRPVEKKATRKKNAERRIMDKYHIITEIGSGRRSQVFKGRQKKTVNYVAIKRVEKSQMEKVVNEVQVIHALSHPHTLKFYDWYETRNNLWLILEYCPGGDLKSLLRVDKQLPIPSVKLFAGDLLAGLQYLHYHGILYCDLKPSNVLMDESGMLKLSGFGLARRIPTASNRSRAPKNRGTPYYTAPELFMEDGVHSYASDLWSLGCVLYELASGRPPFVSRSLNDLMNQIVWADPDLSHDVFMWRQKTTENPSGASSHDQENENPSSVNRGPSPRPTAKLFPDDVVIGRARGKAIQTHIYLIESFTHALKDLLQKDPSKRPTWITIRQSFWADVLPPPPLNKELPSQPLFEETMAAKQGLQETGSSSTIHLEGRRDILLLDDEEEEEQRSARSESIDALQKGEGERDQRQTTTNDEAEDVLRISKCYQEHLSSTATTVAATRKKKRPPSQEADMAMSLAVPAVTADKGWWWESPRQFCAIDPPGIWSKIFTSTDDNVVPILGMSAMRLVFATLSPPSQLPFAPLSVIQLDSLSHPALEAHLVLVYKALVDASFLGDTLNIVAYIYSICEVAQVANIIVNSSFVRLLVKMLRTRSGDITLRHRLLVLVGLLMRHATYMIPIDQTDEIENLAATLTSLVRDRSVEAQTRELSLAALGEFLFYVTAQPKGVAPQFQTFSSAIEVVVSFLCIDHGERESPLASFAAKTIGNIMAYESSDNLVSIRLVAALSQLAAPALAAVQEGAPLRDGPRAATVALVNLFKTMLGFIGADDVETVGELHTTLRTLRKLEAMIVAIKGLGGPDAIAEGVVMALAATEDMRWQMVVLNLLNVILAPRTVCDEGNPDVSGDSAILRQFEARLATDREQLVDDHRVAAALVRTIGGGACITSTVRAKAAVALVQLGALYLPTLASVIVESADSSNKGLLFALEKLVTRDVHELQTNSYFAACIFALLNFVGDTARLLAWVLARAVDSTRADPHSLEDMALDSLSQTASELAFTTSDALKTDIFATIRTKDNVHEYMWVHLTLSDVAASVLLVTSAIASPLLRPHVLTSYLVSDLGVIVSALADFDACHNMEDLPTFYILYQTLPSLLDSLVSRDAIVLLPHARDILRADTGFLTAVCRLVSGSDHDVRLTAAHLLRHTLPPLLQHLGEDESSLMNLFVNQLPVSVASLMETCEDENDESLMETQSMLRLLLDCMARFRAVSAALASSTRLVQSLTICSEREEDPAPTHAILAMALLKRLQAVASGTSELSF